MTDDRFRGDHDSATRGIDSPAEIHVVAVAGPGGVEATEAVPDVAPDQCTGRADREHFVDIVTLALVELESVEAGIDMPRGVDRQTRLEQAGPVPPANLRPNQPDRRRVSDPHDELVQGGRIGRAVVVQQPDPFGRGVIDIAGSAGAPATESRPACTASPNDVCSGNDSTGAPSIAAVTSSTDGSTLPVSTATKRSGARVWAASESSTSGNHCAPSWETSTAVTTWPDWRGLGDGSVIDWLSSTSSAGEARSGSAYVNSPTPG